MSKNKILKKDGVIARGGGAQRAILCYDSGLIYQAADPENILGVYQPGKGWIVRKRPYYHSGGWGRSGSGDKEGHSTISNAMELARAIGGTVYQLSVDSFLTEKEIAAINKGIEKNNKLIEELNRLAKKLNRDAYQTDLTPILSNKLMFLIHRGESAKGENVIKTAERMDDALKVFLDGKGRKTSMGGYEFTPNKVSTKQAVVAFRSPSGDVFLNSQMLNVTHFEENFLGGQSMVQAEIRKIAKYSIPFNVLESAKLRLNETKIVEQGPESTHTIHAYSKYGSRAGTQERHFTGALLLENRGRKFLMDIDRVEIEHGIFNAFFVEVDKRVKSIAEAYESMKPDEVKQAEQKGITVLRQGEWFFIDADKTIEVGTHTGVTRWARDEGDEGHDKPYVLHRAVSHGKGRPNNLMVPVNFGPEYEGLVCGVVSHQGREHADLDLGVTEDKKNGTTKFKLFKLVGNTTVSNFTITGDID